MQQPALHIKNIRTVFSLKQGNVAPVDEVDILLPKGKVVGLVGESGCGKSMTAMSVMNLLPRGGKVVQGEILYNGTNILKLSDKARRALFGSKISMVFQEPMSSLNPVIPVGRQVAEVVRLHKNMDKAQAKAAVIDMFGQVGIPEPARRYSAYPFQLSGGLRQRVMISAAMICRPDVLIADEPTTALDVSIEAQILYLMRQLQKEEGTSILMITHNLGVVAEICDYLYVMYAGRIVEFASVYSFFEKPLHPYAIGLMQSLPALSREKYLNSIPGTVPKLDDMPKGCRFYPRCARAQPLCQESEPQLQEAGGGHLVRCHFFKEEGAPYANA